MSVSLAEKNGPNADPKRNVMVRLGADLMVVPEEDRARLVFFKDYTNSGNTELHYVMPARAIKPPWWAFWRFKHSEPVAFTAYGRGTCWYHAWIELGDKATKVRWDMRIGPATSAILATLWVNREKLVERRD